MANEMEIKTLLPVALRVGETATIDTDVPTIIRRVSLRGGSAAGTIEFFNASLTSTAETYSCATVIGQSYYEDFPDGLAFPTKMFAKLEGAGSMAYVWYE
jgi:hypothetical protein